MKYPIRIGLICVVAFVLVTGCHSSVDNLSNEFSPSPNLPGAPLIPETSVLRPYFQTKLGNVDVGSAVGTAFAIERPGYDSTIVLTALSILGPSSGLERQALSAELEEVSPKRQRGSSPPMQKPEKAGYRLSSPLSNHVSRSYNNKKRERLGRPQDPLELDRIEKSIRQLGISIVFDDKIVGPTELGTLNLGDDNGMVIDYHSGRSWLDLNIERVIDSKVMYAKQGWWTRGKSQSGIPKSKSTGKHPLATRVIDQSSGCGSIMYSKSNTYTCGRYMRTCGDECRNKHVDGEALFRMSLKTLQQIVEEKFGREALVQRLESKAAQEKQTRTSDERHVSLGKLIQQRDKLGRSVDLAGRRMVEEDDEELYQELAKQVKRLKSLTIADATIAAMQKAENRKVGRTDDVDLASILFDNLADHASDPELRNSFSSLVQKSGMLVGLTFAEAVKGKKRIVQKLTGGIVTFSESHLPVPIHGKDRTNSGGI